MNPFLQNLGLDPHHLGNEQIAYVNSSQQLGTKGLPMHSHRRTRLALPSGDSIVLVRLMTTLGLLPLLWCCAPGTSRHDVQPVLSPGQLPVPQKAPQPRKTNSVLVVAEVVRAPRANGAQDEAQCVVTPCRVLLRVRSVLGYSQGFAGAVGQGDSLTVQWRQPRAFPAETSATPAHHATGLTAGTVIQAEIQSQATMGNTPGGGPNVSLRMYQFHIIEGRN